MILRLIYCVCLFMRWYHYYIQQHSSSCDGELLPWGGAVPESGWDVLRVWRAFYQLMAGVCSIQETQTGTYVWTCMCLMEVVL